MQYDLKLDAKYPPRAKQIGFTNLIERTLKESTSCVEVFINLRCQKARKAGFLSLLFERYPKSQKFVFDKTHFSHAFINVDFPH
jgi:hypothetical protein